MPCITAATTAARTAGLLARTANSAHVAPRIDFHTHYLSRVAERFDAPSPAWPRLAVDDAGCGQLTRDGV
ncbi:MAG: hypothetical protein M3154_03375, partial [Candidatus Eremiobacteraeota bacterium]|nr:hypothetical protein [Candidatus Eremiobacteraeota bacterium]